MDRTLLERKALAELREIASTLELRGYQRMKKADLVDLIMNAGGNGHGRADEGGADQPEAEPARGEVTTGTHDGTTGTDEPASPDGRAGRHQPETGRDRAGDDDRDQDRDAAGAERQRTRARRRDDQVDGQDAAEAAPDSRDRDDRAERVRERSREGGSHDSDRDDRGRHHDDRGERSRDDRDQDKGDAQGQRDGQRGEQRGGDQRGGDDQGGGNRNRNKRDRRRKNRAGGGQQQEDLSEAEVREGVLDLLPEGYGFMRCTGYLSGNKDVYVSQSFVRRYNLRRGDMIRGPIRRNKNNDKFPALARVDAVEGEKVDETQAHKRIEFGSLTPLFPQERLRLETEENSPISMRIVDMMAPIGKGQRGLIVSPPKAGKTTILKQLAHAIETNNPEVHLMVLLVDERPEEVTDFERSTKGEVISSTFDRPADDHTQAAELCIERAKRLVERGKDVVILLDSITRLGRAYNLAAPASGRILSGGIDSAALYPPKRFFGSARNIEDGGSLTIIATALIETGSKMDEVIFEEFKGTGNMELRLDRKMEQKRIFPAVDIQASGTRREELLLAREELETVWKLRRLLASMESDGALQLLIDKLKVTQSNGQFLQMIAKSNLQ